MVRLAAVSEGITELHGEPLSGEISGAAAMHNVRLSPEQIAELAQLRRQAASGDIVRVNPLELREAARETVSTLEVTRAMANYNILHPDDFILLDRIHNLGTIALEARQMALSRTDEQLAQHAGSLIRLREESGNGLDPFSIRAYRAELARADSARGMDTESAIQRHGVENPNDLHRLRADQDPTYSDASGFQDFPIIAPPKTIYPDPDTPIRTPVDAEGYWEQYGLELTKNQALDIFGDLEAKYEANELDSIGFHLITDAIPARFTGGDQVRQFMGPYTENPGDS